jgi:hypothetical protein
MNLFKICLDKKITGKSGKRLSRYEIILSGRRYLSVSIGQSKKSSGVRDEQKLLQIS